MTTAIVQKLNNAQFCKDVLDTLRGTPSRTIRFGQVLTLAQKHRVEQTHIMSLLLRTKKVCVLEDGRTLEYVPALVGVASKDELLAALKEKMVQLGPWHGIPMEDAQDAFFGAHQIVQELIAHSEEVMLFGKHLVHRHTPVWIGLGVKCVVSSGVAYSSLVCTAPAPSTSLTPSGSSVLGLAEEKFDWKKQVTPGEALRVRPLAADSAGSLRIVRVSSLTVPAKDLFKKTTTKTPLPCTEPRTSSLSSEAAQQSAGGMSLGSPFPHVKGSTMEYKRTTTHDTVPIDVKLPDGMYMVERFGVSQHLRQLWIDSADLMPKTQYVCLPLIAFF